MKFRYYITDTFQGEILGTNSNELAKTFAECEDYFVVDCETAKWMTPFEVLDVAECLPSQSEKILSK